MYFWTLAWAPLFAYMVIALLLCAFTIYTVTKHTSTMAAYEEGEQGSNATKKLRKFWRYNKRQIAFLCIFVCTTVITLAGWMDAHVDSGTHMSEIEDFAQCLLTKATTDPDHARTVCDQPEVGDFEMHELPGSLNQDIHTRVAAVCACAVRRLLEDAAGALLRGRIRSLPTVCVRHG